MKLKLSLIALTMFASFNTWSALIDQNGNLDLVSACKNSLGSGSCEINENGIRLKLTCGTNALVSGNYGEYLFCGSYSSIKIESNAPIKSITTRCFDAFDSSTKVASSTRDCSNLSELDVKNNMSFDMKYTNGYSASIRSVKFAFGSPNGLNDSLVAADGILYSSYVNALTASNLFKGQIAKTHRGHMARFMTALQDGITLLDSNNKSKVSIVDWRVQENARLIVVFGTIMNELLTDYDDVDNLKVAINSLKSLVDQLRTSYGWERGLAGTASKASAALLNVLRLEIQELASIKMAMGEGNLTPYTDLLRTSGTLLAKVNASKSGDMKAQREIYDMVDAWNSPAFQAELTKLMNAGPDFKNLVLPKLTMLLRTVESINELTEAGLMIPGTK